jgi:hypothetical protein
MSQFVDIKPGQWVLAFPQPYGLWDETTMQEHMERFSSRGGGWDSHRVDEIFAVIQIQKVMPQTYLPIGRSRLIREGERQYRVNVIAAGKTEADMLRLRDKIYAIGKAADDRIEAERYRRVQKFADREHTKALKKIHATLPHIFSTPTKGETA